MARLSFRCDEELVQRVDAARGLVPREAWLRDITERALGSAATAEYVREWHGLPVRSSSQSKRDVHPIPKGK